MNQELLPEGIADEHIEQVLELAERLRANNGGVLDDNAILAVAEATNAPVDYVRLAVRLRGERKKATVAERVRGEILQLEPAVRIPVVSAIGGVFAGIFFRLEGLTDRIGFGTIGSLVGVIGWVAALAVAWTLTSVRTSKVAAIAGAAYGGAYYFSTQLTNLLFGVQRSANSEVFPLYMLFGLVAGLILHKTGDRIRARLGMKDAQQERQDLLRELVSLQDKLRSNEQGMAFLSLDIVGSTRMKQMADPLNVEFTFTEYHRFVEMIVRKHGGRVHSTAGDGVTAAFESPMAALAAAKNVQTGLIELNTFRNKIGQPIVLRAGVHSGSVVVPEAGDVGSVNFAHVIDVAAHIQKACPPGGVAVSEAAAMLLPGGMDAIGTERVEVEGAKGVVWLPRVPIASN